MILEKNREIFEKFPYFAWFFQKKVVSLRVAQIEKDKLLYDAARVYHRAIEDTEERMGIKEKNIKSLDYDSKKD